jgi:hypothetical protein
MSSCVPYCSEAFSINQRDYVLAVTIKSELSSQVINYDIYVWEDISNVTLVSNRLARAFEIIPFTQSSRFVQVQLC